MPAAIHLCIGLPDDPAASQAALRHAMGHVQAFLKEGEWPQTGAILVDAHGTGPRRA
jgi:hypothetical protein